MNRTRYFFLDLLWCLLLVFAGAVGCAEVEPECGAGVGYTDGVMCESELRAELTVSSQYPKPWVFEHAVEEHWSRATQRVAVRFVVVDGPADFHPDNVVCDGRRLAADASMGDAEQFIQHALGHRFGLGHSFDGDNLMNEPDPQYGFINEMSSRDVAHFDRLWAVRRE